MIEDFFNQIRTSLENLEIETGSGTLITVPPACCDGPEARRRGDAAASEGRARVAEFYDSHPLGSHLSS